MKIKTIQFQDYRAFYNGEDEQYLIKTEEKNVLIYGENGSGKTSFFRGLKDFIQSAHSELSSEIDFTLHNRASTGEGFVKVTFSDGTEDVFDEAGTKATKTEVAEASQINTFLSYKELLRTHLIEPTDEINLFPLLVADFVSGRVKKGFLWGHSLMEGMTVGKAFEDFRNSTVYSLPSTFTDALTQKIDNISLELNRFLSYFEQGLEVTLRFLSDIIEDNRVIFYISVEVKLFGKTIPKHQDFLNEARLSALALSIYLSAIASNPTGNTLKCLFLDDVFIGLDMSNRLPLLDILKTEFADYQIFMTTYDRHWFEVAKQWFENKAKDKWKFFELYVDDFTHGFDVPVVLETKTHIEKAEYYLAKHDYSACGLYLRKECERVLSYLLKPAYRVRVSLLDNRNQNYNTEQKRLNDLINSLPNFCRQENLLYSDFEDIGLYKDAVLNPLSHNDINAPIFKQELLAIIKVLKKLVEIKIIEIPKTANKDLILELQIGVYSVEFRPKEDILCLKEPNKPLRLLNALKCTRLSIARDSTKADAKQEFDSIQALYQDACADANISPTRNLFQIITRRSVTLQSMIDSL